ncbi:heavy-metal-associated domain-containing protein [Pseudomonas syringae]|uniref:heavy-metal-associated domain-containing protein n=1 Tax=Pseudomonas syringae TaxID=317 RepID=UPI0023F34B0B|nr:heavy metal-associated domain-containing protein [Pseudomonas syringae]
MSTTELNVQGMTCGACVKHVKAALMASPGVVDVTVELKTGHVLVSGSTDKQSLVDALNEAGYPAQVAEQGLGSTPNAPIGSRGCCCR